MRFESSCLDVKVPGEARRPLLVFSAWVREPWARAATAESKQGGGAGPAVPDGAPGPLGLTPPLQQPQQDLEQWVGVPSGSWPGPHPQRCSTPQLLPRAAYPAGDDRKWLRAQNTSSSWLLLAP